MLPPLKPETSESVIIAQKIIHKGQLFSAIHNGASTIALDKSFSIKITRVNNNMVSLDLQRHAINAEAYSNVVFRPKAKIAKVVKPVVKVEKMVLKKNTEEDLL